MELGSRYRAVLPFPFPDALVGRRLGTAFCNHSLYNVAEYGGDYLAETIVEHSLRDHYLPPLSDLRLPTGTRHILVGGALTAVAIATVVAGPEIGALELIALGGEAAWGATLLGIGAAEAEIQQAASPDEVQFASEFASPRDTLILALARLLLTPEQVRELEELKDKMDTWDAIRNLGSSKTLDQIRGAVELSAQDPKSETAQSPDDKTQTLSSQKEEENND